MLRGRIMKALSGFYYVQTDEELLECRARGKFRKEGMQSPSVGDLVEVSKENGKGMIETILPRKNSFIRNHWNDWCSSSGFSIFNIKIYT